MLLSLYTYNGIAINDGTNYEAVINPAQTMPGANAAYVDRGQTWPYLAGKTLNGGLFTFQIVMKGTLHSKFETLKALFRTDDFNYRRLVAKDTADSDRQWYIEGYPVLPPSLVNTEGGTAVNITLAIKDPVWREDTLQTDTWAVTASGQTRAITARGNYAAQPIFTITPTSAKTGGYGYKRFVILYNQSSRPLADYPFALTLDTATLISGGKMQADGDDYRVLVDGQDTDRWLYGINTASTNLWFNLTMKAKVELTTRDAIAGSGTPTTIIFANTVANKNAIKLLPSAGLVLIDSELFAYSAVNVAAMSITLVERDSRGTTIASHAAGATVRWIEHEIWLVYGNSTVAAPVVDDTYKPVIELNSTNGSWIYTLFDDGLHLRPGAWKAAILKSVGKANTYTYPGNRLERSADPATEAGMTMGAYQGAGIWKAETAKLEWKLYNPCGFTSLSAASGEKYRTNTSWPTAVLQKSKDGVTWVNVASITTPASAASWTAWTAGTVALSAGPWLYFRIYFDGTQSAGANAYCAVEMETVTLAVDSAAAPASTILAEQSNYTLDVTLSNTTTGEYVQITAQTALNAAIIIDCESQVCYRIDGENLLAALTLSSKRAEWLSLGAGSNTLSFVDTGTAAVTVKTDWRGRNLV
jgi:hypothetical protein